MKSFCRVLSVKGISDIVSCSDISHSNDVCGVTLSLADVFLKSSPEVAMQSEDYSPVPTLVAQNSVEGMIIMLPDVITEGTWHFHTPRRKEKTCRKC